jgi:hypothetical protein
MPSALWLEHERVELPVYAHEWIADQLFAAGLLTIDLAIAAADAGMEMKDATPYNVLVSKGRAVFCDVLTFVKRSASPLWPPYGQFQRNIACFSKDATVSSRRKCCPRCPGTDA